MTFNQEHDGTFGAILSGLNEVRNAGVNERQLDKIPTDNNGNGQEQTQSQNSSSGFAGEEDAFPDGYIPERQTDWIPMDLQG